MISQFGREAERLGYRRVIINISHCQMYYREEERALATLVFFDCPRGDEFTRSQAEEIGRQIREGFAQGSGKRVLVQGIICTEDVQTARRMYSPLESQWIVDLPGSRLLIYDEIRPEVREIRDWLEEQLDSRRITAPGGERYEEQYDPEIGNSQMYPRVKTFHFTPVNAALVVINVAVYAILSLRGNMNATLDLLRFGGLFYPYIVEKGQYYRLFTYMFLHAGFAHLFNNMLVLAFLGDNLERKLGKLKYLIFYLLCGVIAGVASVGWDYWNKDAVVGVGASGAIFAVVGALVYLLILHKGQMEDLNIGRLLFFTALSLANGFAGQNVDNVAHVVGFLSGFLLGMLFYRREKV